jgi:hypothetical protein
MERGFLIAGKTVLKHTKHDGSYLRIPVIRLKLGSCVRFVVGPSLKDNKAKEMNGFGALLFTPMDFIAMDCSLVSARRVIRHGA